MAKIDKDDALQRAIELVGGVAAMGEILGISPSAVSQWTQCPIGRVMAVSDATGGKITPHALRPDIYRPGMRRAAQ